MNGVRNRVMNELKNHVMNELKNHVMNELKNHAWSIQSMTIASSYDNRITIPSYAYSYGRREDCLFPSLSSSNLGKARWPVSS